MASMKVRSGVSESAIGATVKLGPESAARLGVPEGTVVDYGMVAYHSRNPLKRARFWILKKTGRKVSMYG